MDDQGSCSSRKEQEEGGKEGEGRQAGVREEADGVRLGRSSKERK